VSVFMFTHLFTNLDSFVNLHVKDSAVGNMAITSRDIVAKAEDIADQVITCLYFSINS